MGFLIEVFWALFMVGVPIGIFTLALVWWSLQSGHFKESRDTDALMREIKTLTGKKKRKKKSKKDGGQDDRKLHPLQKKWARFGGGFYGIVAFFTYLVIEMIEIITTISDLGGFIDFLKHLNFNLIIQMFVAAIMNFVNAMIWPVYWMRRVETDQVWIWFAMAYAGYWCGLKLAQMLIQNRSQSVT